MANVQKQFEQFHYAIRMDYEHSATLREKRSTRRATSSPAKVWK